ncbi:hypothetical protein HKD37_01G001871 [Glycine soja]
MQNSGVTLRAESQHFASVNDANPCVASIPYFGFIDEIWELNYVKFMVCVFKCKWVDSNTSVRTDDIGFTLVDLKKLGYHNDPFIMAEQARQVFYMQDPCDERWCVILQGKTIGVNVEDDDSYMETYVSPLTAQITPNVVGEEEADDVALERSTPICVSSSSTSSISFLSTFVFVVYKSKAEPLEHTKKRDTGHQSVSLENKTGDSTVLKIGNSAKVVIKQDMKGRRHKYGFNNNKREKAEKKRVVDDETGDKHQLDEWTCKASRLRSLSTRPPGAERPVVHVDPAIGKADGPHKKKLRTYLGIVARDKVDVTYENWKEVPTTQKDLIWEDIHDGVEDTVCEKYGISKEKWAQFCQTRRDPSWEDVRKKAQAIQKQNTAPHVLSRGGYDYLEQKLLAEKTKKLEEAAQSGSVDGVIDPPSPVRRHVKWKMARTKKTGEMTTEAAKEIAKKIDSFEEQATQGSFVPHGRQDVLAVAIGRPEHPGRVRAARAGVTIKQYFGSAPRTSRNASSLPPDELQQLTHQIRDQLEESITEKVMRQVMASFSHMQSQLQSQMQSQGLAVPPEPLVGPSGPRVSTKGSCVDPSGNDPETGDSDRCGLYIEADPARLVAMGRVYEGSIVVHNTPLLLGQVKVSVEEVTDADAPVPVPTDEVSLVGQALHTFLAWPTHLVKSLSQQVAVSPAKPPPKPDPEVDDPLYLMTLTIPELFLRPYQVRWDATVFGVFNPDFPLYIKHEDLSEIAHGGQCLSISVLQLWILGHWHMVVILPKEHLVVWFCSLHNRPDTYALKGLDDAPQPKSKASARWIVVKCNRQKGSTECGYYVMHWMSTIILGTFRNNWEAYFNDPRPLEPNRLKALRIQWAQFYLRVRDQA